MAREKLTFTFNEASIANADTEIDDYVDTLWDAVGASQDLETLDLVMKVNHYTGASSRISIFKMYVEGTTQTLVKAQVADFTTGVAAVIAESGLTTVSSCYGNGIITVEY